MDNSSAIVLKRLLKILVIIVIFWGIYLIASGIYDLETTGTLIVHSDSSALLTISQTGRHSQNIGTGSARIKLKPGTYEILASKGFNQSIKTVHIYAKTTLSLNVFPNPNSAVNLQNYSAANQLIKSLPFYGPNFDYYIDFHYVYTSSVAQPVIVVSLKDPSFKPDALAWIQAMGYDPSKLNIQFLELSNSGG